MLPHIHRATQKFYIFLIVYLTGCTPENLTINTRIVTDGASNLIQVRGNLPADKKKLIKHLEYQISNADEASLREYRVNLRHL